MGGYLVAALAKSLRVVRESGHVDVAVRCHQPMCRSLHASKEARARAAEEEARGGAAGHGRGHVGVCEHAARDDTRDLAGRERRLARASGLKESGAVGRRWRPEARGLVANELPQNPLARPWLVGEDHSERRTCVAPRRQGLEILGDLDAALDAVLRRP